MLVQIKTFGRKPMRDNQITKMLLAVLLTICVSVTTARSAELIPLRATYAAIGGAFAPLWIAQDKGVFNKYGLAVDLKYMLSATGTQALFFFFKQKTAYEIGLGIPAEPLFRSICKYAFLQITRRRFLNEWEAFKKVISRRN